MAVLGKTSCVRVSLLLSYSKIVISLSYSKGSVGNSEIQNIQRIAESSLFLVLIFQHNCLLYIMASDNNKLERCVPQQQSGIEMLTVKPLCLNLAIIEF